MPFWARAAAICTRLRALGYPTPRYLAVGRAGGGTYTLQEELRGAPIGRPTAELVAQGLALCALQAGQARHEPRTWPEPAMRPVLEGGQGFCLHESLRAYSAHTAELLGIVQRIVSEGLDLPFRGDDIVHYDFTLANMLAEQGAITGVIDWDAACAGDRTFDLATLLFYCAEDQPTRERLWREIEGCSSPHIAAVYLAHLMLRQVDWSIRHHTADDVARWMAVSQLLLSDIHERR